MTNRSVTVSALISLMGVASMASAHSYSSTKGLLNLVRNDAAALERYESHFGMNRDEVIAYLGDLHPGTLAKAGTFAICEPAFGGTETQVTLKLERGEAVFLDKTNAPILLADGGYPMTASLNDTVQENKGDNAPASSADAMPATATSAETPMAMMAPGTSMVSGGQNYKWLSVVPVLIPVLGMTNTGNGGNGGTINPVPEPASFAILGVGALGLLRRRKKA